MKPHKNPDKMIRPSLIRAVWNPRMLICIVLGFSSGLPLYVLLQLIPAWLRRSHIDLTSIGIVGLAQIPYAWKFLWAPLCDRYGLKNLGRRRTWMLGSQIFLVLAMMSVGILSPSYDMRTIIAAAFIVAVFSATQDIAIDAYRRELLPDAELGLGNSFFVNAYRVAGLIPGGLSLIIADHLAWPWVFIVTALFMIPGMVCSVLIREAAPNAAPPRTLRAAVIEPFHEFFTRTDIRCALLTLAFLLLYKFGDSLATAQLTPFYIDMGFTNSQIGTVVKLVGFWSTIAGAFLGGLIMVRIGINRALWLFGGVQVLSIMGFALLSTTAMNIYYLGLAVGFEYFGVGLGTTAFVSFIAAQTNKKFSATQFALFSSLFAIPRSITGVIAGFIIEKMGLGWTNFFLISAVTALPGMALLYWVAPWKRQKSQGKAMPAK